MTLKDAHAPLLWKERSTSRELLRKLPVKRRIWFGFLPLWQETVPLHAGTGKVDWTGVAANVGIGLLIGLREALGGIVSASLIFSSADNAVLCEMFPFGIGMMWYSTSLGVLWYAIFGRLQYAYGTAQDVVGILQAGMLVQAANDLEDRPELIPATAVAIICLSSVITGVCSLAMGKFGLGKYMLLFPSPVTSGFLGAIGFVILRNAVQTSSGVRFKYFYPVSMDDFLKPHSLAQMALQVLMVLFIRLGPCLLKTVCPKNNTVEKLSGIVCQLLPLALFYVAVVCAGISIDDLTKAGWMYPNQQSGGLVGHWTTYSVHDVDVGAVMNSLPDMPALVLMAVLCTSTGALAITDRFPSGPEGDPAPTEAVDFDIELATVGVSDVLLGLTGGTLTFHTFTAIQLRLDGGTHRIAVLAVALLIFTAFATGAPIGHYIPKWFLSGLFMNTAVHFLKGSLWSFQSLPSFRWMGMRLPSLQYLVTLTGIGVSIFCSPAKAIGAGMVLSIAFFMVQSARASPVVNVVVGDRVVSRTKRPFWEMRVLRQEGSRILLIYLQGQLFFGSVRRLVAALTAAASSDRVQFIILSFARVPMVDPSAARHLKAIVEKAGLVGCQLICCRMNLDVFSSLRAAGVVLAPDADLLLHLKGLRWTAKSLEGPLKSSPQPSKGQGRNRLTQLVVPAPAPKKVAKPMAAMRHSWAAQVDPDDLDSPISSKSVKGMSEVFWQGDPNGSSPRSGPEADAFTHETDALDYCNERILADFCYGRMRDWAEAPLKAHMLAFRRSCAEGVRLEEWAFEQMNNLPQGFMTQLKEHCEVMAGVKTWKELEDTLGNLLFIMRGSISLVQMLPHAQDISQLEPEVRGFSFRVGKRLRKRYPPGHVVGAPEFFLQPLDQVVDRELVPKPIISSKLAPEAEVWVLRREKWQALPSAIQAPLTNMLCAQMADDAQHSQLQEN